MIKQCIFKMAVEEKDLIITY